MNRNSQIKNNLLTEYSSLLKSYSYPNQDKLIVLMDFWLDIYFVAIKNKLKLPSNCMDLYIALSKDDFNFPKVDSNRNNFSSYVKNYIKYILSLTPIPYGVLMGGYRKKLDKYFYYITREKLQRINCLIDYHFKSLFLSKVKKYLTHKELKQLKYVISDKFFIKLIRTKNLPNLFYGAPDNLYKEEFCHLLFVNQKLNFIGFQHGGQYGELKKDRFGEFEYSISNDYYFWGFGAKNIRQNRFPYYDKSFDKIKQVLLIEFLKPNQLLNNFFGGYEEMYKQLSRQNKIVQNSNFSIGVLKHPRSFNDNFKSNRKILFNDLKESEIHSSLYIINFPTQTFMYKAIYGNLPFLIFIDRGWHKWFTPNYSSFLKFCNKQGVLFYWDQEDEFISYIHDILANSMMRRSNNKDLISYLEKNIK